MTVVSDRSRLLRFALRGNAAFSTLSAAVFLTASGQVASFLGLLSAQQVLLTGVQLALFALWLWWLSRRPSIPQWQVWLIIALDVAWVVGSFGVVLSSPPALSAGGKWAIAAVADVVGLFAVLQFLGWLRYRRTSLPAGA